jgi:hypothetical protein
VKIGTILKAINKCGAVHVCLGLCLALSWSAHCIAVEKMEACNAHPPSLNDRALRSIATLVEWAASNHWPAFAYPALIVTFVVWLQIRGRPAWTHWLAALLLSVPSLVYWSASMYLATALTAR